MKIAVTIESFGSGGAETSTRQIAEGFRDRGHEVTLLTGFLPPEKRLAGIAIEAAGKSKLKTGRAIRRYRSFAMERMRAGGFDTSLSVTTLCPARVVQPRAGIYRELWGRTRRPTILHAKRRAMWDAEAATLADPEVEAWVAISRFMQEQIVLHTHRSADAVAVIANGAPRLPPPDGSAEFRAKHGWGLHESHQVFLFPSDGSVRKGAKPLRKAWAEVVKQRPTPYIVDLDSGRLDVKVSSTTVLVSLGAARRSLDLKRRLIRVPATDNMSDAFAGASVLVLPSFYDPAAKVVAEALQAGVPVITTRTNGSCDLIEGSRAGRIIDDARDTDALAAAMLEFCDPFTLAEARAATAAAAAGATMDEHIDKLLAVLEAAAG